MFAKRPLRYGLSGLNSLRVVKDINDLGYAYTSGYCQGLVSRYTLARLKGRMTSLNTWLTALKSTPNFGKHFKAIQAKKESQENLSKEETAVLEKLPGDPRTFLDEVVLFQDPTLESHKSFLVNPALHQGDVIGGLRSVDEKYSEGVVDIFHDSMIKTQAEMQDYFARLAAILKEEKANSEMDYVLVLANSGHTLTCSPSLEHQHWELFDPAQLEVAQISLSEVSPEVHQSFLLEEDPKSLFHVSKVFLSSLLLENYTAFSIKIITSSDNPNIPAITQKLQQFKEQQVITKEIAARKTRYGTTIGHIAAREGDTQVMEKLSQLDCDLNSPVYNSWRPLDYASKGGYADIVNILIRKGIDPIHSDSDGTTPLMLAAGNGNPETVQLLLEEYKRRQPAMINAHNNFHATALMWAADTGNLAAVNLLLAYGGNPFFTNKPKRTPLMAAAMAGHSEVVDVLAQKMLAVGKEISIDSVDVDGYSAAALAAINGHHEVIRTLTKYRPLSAESGAKLMHIAISCGYPKVIKALHEAQVPININCEDENSKVVFNLAHMAVHHKNIYVIRCLAELDFNFTQEVSASNGSAITWAIQNEQWNLAARMLMATCEDLSERDRWLIGMHTASIVKAYQAEKAFSPAERRSNVMAYLSKQSADHQSDSGGNTPAAGVKP